MKKVLTVQDLSCLGKCSLTVALPVLSAMGCAATPLPTAVLSTHTAFPEPHVLSLTEDMDKIRAHWQRIGATFDALCVGYLSDPGQVRAVERLAQSFSAKVILDPVLGDNGKLYSRITGEHIQAMRQLCALADVLLPNLTEAAALTGMDYVETPDEAYCRRLIAELEALGAKCVVLTGVSMEPGFTGFMTSGGEVYRAKKLPGSFHGTGDLFAAAFAGGFVREMDLFSAGALAAGFVEQVITGAEPTPFGVEFESKLPWLWEQLK